MPATAPTATTVLIVDDDDDIREALADVIRGAGYRIVEATNGKPALEYLRAASEPTIMLLDLMMPIVDGHEVLRRVAEERLRVETIVLSASGAASTVPPGTVFLAKPVHRTTLLEFVNAASNVLSAAAWTGVPEALVAELPHVEQ
jgi:CheY-like chemotaxis protein